MHKVQQKWGKAVGMHIINWPIGSFDLTCKMYKLFLKHFFFSLLLKIFLLFIVLQKRTSFKVAQHYQPHELKISI